MKKVLHSYVFRTIIAALLVIAMGAIQYEPMISGFKFWIAFVVIVCVMIYIVAMVSSMQKKISSSDKALKAISEKTAENRIPEKES